MIRTARLRAFAKLNLGLRVLFRRPDGYHEIRTVFQTVSLADRLEVSFTPARRTEITVRGSDIPDNIIVRAARMTLDALRVPGVVQFFLKKNIPSGAGLGGGSSDAAAVLLALPVLAGKDLAPARLSALASELGSDVPFFLEGGTALGIGRGEEIYQISTIAASNVLLVAPGVHSSTEDAYRDLSKKLNPADVPAKLIEFQSSGRRVNDFEEVVFARYPELLRIRNRLRKAGAVLAAMTGSGSALFGVFDDRTKFIRANAAFPGQRVCAISFVSRTQYQRAWKRALQTHTKGDQWPPQSLYAQ